MDWPPNDAERKLLFDLAKTRIIEYHGTEDTPQGRRHQITTCTGYEVTLSDDEVACFALGACAGDFNQTHDYDNTPSDIIDELVAQRWHARMT